MLDYSGGISACSRNKQNVVGLRMNGECFSVHHNGILAKDKSFMCQSLYFLKPNGIWGQRLDVLCWLPVNDTLSTVWTLEVLSHTVVLHYMHS